MIRSALPGEVNVVDRAIGLGKNQSKIAGTVASMTESDPDVESEKISHNVPG